MKLRVTGLLAVLALATAMAKAQPAVQLTIKNLNDLGQALNRVAKAVDPSAQEDHAQEMNKHLGLTNFSTFDAKAPWEVALWYDAGGTPLIAVKGPIKNVSSFKTNLDPEGLLLSQGKDFKQLENGLASITFKPSEDVSETETAALKQWNAQPIQPPKKSIELALRLSEATRAQAKGMLGLGRMTMGNALESGDALAATGVNPKAMTGMFNAYFDLLDTFIAGFQELRLGLDVSTDAIQVDELITAKSGSELAKWLQAPPDHLTTADLGGLDPDALGSTAGYFGKNDSFMKILKQFTALGLQMQNMDTNTTMLNDINSLVDQMLPMKFSGSAFLKNQLTFSGAYSFPGRNAADLYAQMKKFINQNMKSQVGEGKMYSAFNFAEKHHTIDGVSVDRLTLTINPDSPLMKLPGQKEQMKAFWPEGKLEFDYAIKDGKFLLASASGDQMKNLIAGNAGRKAGFNLQESPCLAGYFNLLGFIKVVTQSNPMLPDPVKEKLGKVDPKNTTIEFQASLNNNLHVTGRVPLKLLTEFGRLKDSP